MQTRTVLVVLLSLASYSLITVVSGNSEGVIRCRRLVAPSGQEMCGRCDDVVRELHREKVRDQSEASICK